MRILFLSRWFPYPPDNGARLRIYNLIRYLARIATVDLLAFHSAPAQPEMLEMGLCDCHTIGVVPYQPFRPSTLQATLGFFNSKPRSVVATHSNEMAQRVKYALSGNGHDLVIVSQRDMADYLDGIEHPTAILEELELSTFYEAYAHEQALTHRIRSGLTWWKAARYYRRILDGYAASTVVSEDEKRVVQHVTPVGHRLEVVPNGIDLAHYRALETQPQERTILYCGSLTYNANFDAVSFFLDEILPQILDAHPHAKLRVTGALHGVDLDKLPRSEHVEFTGYLEDVRPIIAKSWVSVVPLRIGGGTRLKILESLAMGTPVIATRKGAQGLAIQSGEGMLIADSPQQFGEYVIDVFEQPELRQALSMAGKISVRTYDWERIAPQLNSLVLELTQSNSTP